MPFTLYADIESILKPLNYPRKTQKHIPAAVGYYVKCSYDNNLSFYRAYRGEDYMEWFAAEINQLAEDLEKVFRCPLDIDMTTELEAEFQRATHCHICKQPFKVWAKESPRPLSSISKQ